MDQDNMEDPLKSSYSIRILRTKSTKLLSALLNTPKVRPNSEGLPRTWIGLAELCSIESYLVSNFEFSSDPTLEVLRHWQGKGEATICQLMKNLERLERFDLIYDLTELIAEDVKFHKNHPNGFRTQSALTKEHEKNILTVDDVASIDKTFCPMKYDAFVLFADDDIDFATEMIETMEKQYNLKFCVKDRDLIGGTFEHNAIIKLISERCDKLIAILSPCFFVSPMNTFFLNFTHALSYDQRKVIPCLYKFCPEMPAEFKCYFMLDYTRPRILWNFWDKLYEAITTEKAPPNAANRIGLTLARRDPPPRQLIIKTNSHRDTESRLRVPKHTVKFNSLVDLTRSDMDQIMPDTNLIPSTSANSLGLSYNNAIDQDQQKNKNKQKLNWFRKFLQKYEKNYEKCNNNGGQQQLQQKKHIGNAVTANGELVVGGNNNNNREKRRFWNRHRKRKVEVAT